MFSSKDLFFTPTPAATGYQVAKSLRFRSSASAYLTRTFGTPTNNTTWTFSAWMKRGKLSSSASGCFFGGSSGTNYGALFFNGNDVLGIISNSGSGVFTTTAIFKDPSAWYHVLFSSNGTTISVYVNNVSYGAYTGTVTQINSAISMDLGASRSNGYYFDGYMADVNFVDGSAKNATDFGEYNSTTGVWQPKTYTGTYGNNGFYLKFTDVGTTSGSNSGYGKDFAGTNYWATNNFGTTSTPASSGVSYDSMTDSPTAYSADVGNYCTWNPLSGLTGTLSEANLYFYGPSAYASRMGTVALPTSGKIYFEATLTVAPYTPRASNTGYNWVGVALSTNFNVTSTPASNNVNGLMVGDNGYINNFASSASDTGSSFSVNDVIGFAIDTGANTYTIYKNNSSIATGTIGVTSGTSLNPMQVSYDASYGAPKLNFGQRPFAYTAPSGFVALNTYNLPTPTIANGASYMAAVLYQGNGSTQTITTSSSNSGNNPNGVTFQPDLVWVKARVAASNHCLTDAVRGAYIQLASNNTNAEGNYNPYGITAFNSNGFAVSDIASGGYNVNGSSGGTYSGTPPNYVAWEWNAGGSNATNTSGSITSTVRANTTAGFSIVTFNSGASATAQTIGHGLGVAPSLIIVKNRDSTGSWLVYFSTVTNQNQYLLLNTTGAVGSLSGVWGTNLPTSSVFGITTGTTVLASNNIVAYCWAAVSSYSSFGQYTGSGSTDGPFIYTGFRPRWIMIKSINDTSVPTYDSWKIIDTSRSPYNVANPPPIWANANYQEGLRGNGGANSATIYENILSNGFKLGAATSYEVETNESGVSYLYAAFAENPFKYALAR